MNPFWDKEITYLKGVGPRRADALQKELGIYSYGDLLAYYPRKYVDRSSISQISNLDGTENYVTLVGKITQLSRMDTQRGRGIESGMDSAYENSLPQHQLSVLIVYSLSSEMNKG